MPKYLIIDTETTGLDCLKHEILSIGAIVYLDGVVTEKLEIKIRPEKLEAADPEALKVNGYSEYRWKNALSKSKAFHEIWLPFLMRNRDAIFVGHNLQFDRRFLNQFYFQFTEDIEHLDIRSGYIDTRDLCRVTLGPLGLDSMSLDNICEFLGWQRRKAHTALSDCEDCLRLLQNLSPPSAVFILKLKTRLKIKNLIYSLK